MTAIVQLKPPRAEELAAVFERYAAEARAGDVTGYNGIIIRPGGKYTTVGWQGDDADAFQEMGMLLTCLFETFMATRRE